MDIATKLHGLMKENRNVVSSNEYPLSTLENALNSVLYLMNIDGSQELLKTHFLSDEVAEARRLFFKYHYSSWLSCLIDCYSVEWANKLPRGAASKYMDSFFLNGSHEAALQVLVRSIKRYRYVIDIM